MACYLPMALAGREQMRGAARGSRWNVSKSAAQALPYAAMVAALLVLVSLTHGDSGESRDPHDDRRVRAGAAGDGAPGTVAARGRSWCASGAPPAWSRSATPR